MDVGAKSERIREKLSNDGVETLLHLAVLSDLSVKLLNNRLHRAGAVLVEGHFESNRQNLLNDLPKFLWRTAFYYLLT